MNSLIVGTYYNISAEKNKIKKNKEINYEINIC